MTDISSAEFRHTLTFFQWVSTGSDGGGGRVGAWSGTPLITARAKMIPRKGKRVVEGDQLTADVLYVATMRYRVEIGVMPDDLKVQWLGRDFKVEAVHILEGKNRYHELWLVEGDAP